MITALKAVLPLLALIIVVLGSIFAGIATPTESVALGGAGAIVLSLLYRQFSWSMVYEAPKETVKVTAMVFAILLGAMAFSMTFIYTGGDYLIEEWMLLLSGEKWGFLIITMLVILILGFFIDFVEISAEKMVQAIKTVNQGSTYFCESVTQTLFTQDVVTAAQKPSPLSRREEAVLKLVAQGHSSKKIATLLDISYRTVETHCHNIKHKLDLYSTVELAK